MLLSDEHDLHIRLSFYFIKMPNYEGIINSYSRITGFSGLSPSSGRAIAQAVSRWLSTAAARVRDRVWSCGICGGQSGAGAGFLRVLRFPLPIFIPLISPQSPSSIIWGWYNRPVVAAVPSGLSLTPLTTTTIIQFNSILIYVLANLTAQGQLQSEHELGYRNKRTQIKPQCEQVSNYNNNNNNNNNNRIMYK
jgi:hypothetical protein